MRRLFFSVLLACGFSSCVTEEHKWVDLGLSVKWSTCNLGASAPEEYGDYYAWGEVATKTEYTESNCSTIDKSLIDISASKNHDAARIVWGGKWRIPTETEFQELIDNCTWTWETLNGNNGCKVTGPNGNSIFIPAAGTYRNREVMGIGKAGLYWTSTQSDKDNLAKNIICSDAGPFMMGTSFDVGYTIRPVLD